MACKKLSRRFTNALLRRLRPGFWVEPAEFHTGMRVESEHEDITRCDPEITASIALAHLRERSDYYSLLRRYVER